MQRDYRDLIFTKHALERADGRGISQEDVFQVVSYPSASQATEKPGSTKFIKKIHDRTIHVVATRLEDQGKWLIISVWVRGEEDKVPLIWQLLTLPFKAVWYLLKLLFGAGRK